MNTTQLECFLAVAQYLNFSKAAESVRITQPAVSHQIQTLEEELGIRLFTRTSKSVSLTHAGMQFIGDAATILKIAGTARARLSDQQAQQAIYLGIGLSHLAPIATAGSGPSDGEPAGERDHSGHVQLLQRAKANLSGHLSRIL